MRHLSAYMLLVLGGNKKPTAEDIKTVLDTVGAEADDDKIETVIADLEGKDIAELIKEGLTKLVSIPTGGATHATSATGAASAEEKKEEVKEEEEEEEEVDMSGGGLFGGDEEEDW